MSDDGRRWGRQARKLARASRRDPGFAGELARQVLQAGDTDLGTMVVAGAVLTEHAARGKVAARYRAGTARRERRERAADDRRMDGAFIVGWLGLAVTVVLPWLLGRYKLRDTWLLPTRTVAPPEVRDYVRSQVGHYFWPDYLTGLAVFAVIVALVLLCRPWPGRRVGIVVGVALLAGSWGAHVGAVALWNTQEDAVSASRVYPFPQGYENDSLFERYTYATCGMSNVVDMGGHKYYVWTARGISTVPIDLERSRSGDRLTSCDLVFVYTDWTRVRGVESMARHAGARVMSAASGGRVCDTDGTADGLIWFAPNAAGDLVFTVPLLGDHAIDDAAPQRFAQDYPMCQTGG
jgi:hypothetical protein